MGDLSATKIEEIKLSRGKVGLKNGEFPKIVAVTKWFYDQLKRSEVIIVFDKDGYVGLSVAAEIGACHILGKPTFFLEEPKDEAIRALLSFSANFKVVSREKLMSELETRYLRKNNNESQEFISTNRKRGKKVF